MKRLLLLFVMSIHTCSQTTNPPDMKVSVIIPCHAHHVRHLYNLVKCYEQQTELPDEIVISLSSATEVIYPQMVEVVREGQWPFSVIVLSTAKDLFAGENRNRACERATGDILICQDADDIPYPQRVEIIKQFFRTYQIDHLVHQWVGLGSSGKHDVGYLKHTQTGLNVDGSFRLYEQIEDLSFFNPHVFEEVLSSGSFTNGNCALTKEVFNAVKWSSEQRGQDVSFNRQVYQQFSRCYALQVPLLVYRFF